MTLPMNCANCEHYDGDGHCTLTKREGLVIPGYIVDAGQVVCAKHELRTREGQEAQRS